MAQQPSGDQKNIECRTWGAEMEETGADEQERRDMAFQSDSIGD